MKVFISLGAIIGVAIIILYYAILRVYYFINDKKSISPRHKLFYKSLIVTEFFIILLTIIIPIISDKDYLLDGMTSRGFHFISEDTFKVSYAQSKRVYQNTLHLDEKELENVRVICSAKEGSVWLRICQNEKESTLDITNVDEILDLSGFMEGYITFGLKNENGRYVKFELDW